MTELDEQFKEANEGIKNNNLDLSVDRNIDVLLDSIDIRINNNSEKFRKRISNVFKNDGIDYVLSELAEIIDLEKDQLKDKIHEVIETEKEELKETVQDENSEEEKTDEQYENMKENVKKEVNESVLMELKSKLKDKYTLSTEEGLEDFDKELSIYSSSLSNDINDQIEFRRLSLKNKINDVKARVENIDAKVMSK